MNRTKGWIYLTIIGAILLIPGGILTLTTATDIRCNRAGSPPMAPGDVCEPLLGDSFTYDQKLAANYRLGWIELVLGLGLLLAAAYFARELWRHRRAVATATEQSTGSWYAVVTPIAGARTVSDQLPQQLAATHRLGGFTGFYQPDKRLRQIISLSVIAAIATGVAGFFHYAAAVDSTLFIGVPLLFDAMAGAVLIGLGWNLVRSPLLSPKARRRGYYLYAEGLVEVGRSGAIGYRWDELVSIYQERYLSKNGLAVDYWAELNFADGHRMTMTTHSADMAELLPHVNQAVSLMQLPKAREHLRRGSAVDFGDYAVTPTGLSMGGAPEIAWSQIAGAATELERDSAERLVIKGTSGWRSVSTRPTRMIPNLCTFLAIANGYIVPNAPARSAYPSNG